jgi:hypothetical protein
MSRAAMKLALEALESYKGFIDDAHILEGQWRWIDGADNAQTALREALAKPDFWEGYVPEPAQQEPVACFSVFRSISGERNTRFLELASLPDGEHYFYTPPPAQRTWVGLTTEDRLDCWDTMPEIAICKTEAKLKEKNQ